MLGFNFIIRSALAAVIFYYLVLQWALVPYLDRELVYDVGYFSSIFFGTVQPRGGVRDLLCLARGLFGMTVVVYVFLPGLRLFFDFEPARYSNTIGLVLAGLMTAAYILAIVVFWLFYR